MTVSPLLVLGVAVAVFAVAIAFLVTTAKARRDRIDRGGLAHVEATGAPSASETPVDPGSLTPDEASPWVPSGASPRTEALEGLSLDDRIRSFTPAPTPAPQVTGDAHEPWVVDATRLAQLAPGARVGEVVAPWAELVPEVQVSAAPAPAAPSRPEAHVRPNALQALGVGEGPLGRVAHVDAEPMATRESAPDLQLAAPIELWFEDSRVGVRAGSPTFDRFRKYADALIRDLNDARNSSR